MASVEVYSVDDLIAYAKRHSPFYRNLYQGFDTSSPLPDLPVINQTEFWQAYEQGALLTAPLRDGKVFKSGGTTGNPKFSVFADAEWETFTRLFGRGIAAGGGLQAGDRVANLFYVGDLYASFLFIQRSIENSSVPCVQFPIGGATTTPSVLATIRDFNINVIAGVPTSLLNMAHYLIAREEQVSGVTSILFGGESLYDDQLTIIRAAFPEAKCQSIGWASVDAGLLGYCSPDCANGEHRSFGAATCLEILDEDTNEVIVEPGIKGKLVLTNLTRRLMPIIRYPIGDCGMWVEGEHTPDRKVKLLGRSEEGARVGPATVYTDDVRRSLAACKGIPGYTNFQIVTRHYQGLDELKIRIGVKHNEKLRELQLEREFRNNLYQHRKMLADLADNKIIHPTVIEWTAPEQLERNARTGKLRQVIDERS